MPPLLLKLGTVPTLFGPSKQKKKAKSSPAQPRAPPRTPTPDSIDLDLARGQRQQCCLYLLQRVEEAQLRREEQPVEQDQRVYQMTVEQQEALDDLRAQGFRGGMGLDGTPLISPSYPSSGSQISPFDNTHNHGPLTDGPSNERLNPSNLRIPSSKPSTRDPVRDEDTPAGFSRSTSISPTRFQNRYAIETGSQQQGREVNQNKVPLSKIPQATSSQQIEESPASQRDQNLPTPDTNGMPGSFFLGEQTSGEVPLVTERSPNTSPPQYTKSSAVFDSQLSPDDSRTSSDYHSAPEEPLQTHPGLVEDETVNSEAGTSRQTIVRPDGLQINGMEPERSCHGSESSPERFPSLQQSLAEVANARHQETNNPVVNQRSMQNSNHRDTEARDNGVPACQPHKPNAYSRVDYVKLLEEMFVSDNLCRTKMHFAVELVEMLQEFKNQVYKDKQDSEAGLQTEIGRWEEYYRSRTNADMRLRTICHPNLQLIDGLKELSEGDPWIPNLIARLKHDKDFTQSVWVQLDKMQKNRQRSEDTLVGDENNSDGSGNTKDTQKSRKVSRTWTIRAGRKWNSWVGSTIRATRARTSVIDAGVFRPQNVERPAGSSLRNTPSAPVPMPTAVMHNGQHVAGASNPEITLSDQLEGPEENTGKDATKSGTNADTFDLYTNKRPADKLGTIVDEHLKQTQRSSTSAERLRDDPQTFGKFSSVPSQVKSGVEGPNTQAITSAPPPLLSGQGAAQTNGTAVDQNDRATIPNSTKSGAATL